MLPRVSNTKVWDLTWLAMDLGIAMCIASLVIGMLMCSHVNLPYFCRGGENTSGHTCTILRANRNVGLHQACNKLTAITNLRYAKRVRIYNTYLCIIYNNDGPLIVPRRISNTAGKCVDVCTCTAIIQSTMYDSTPELNSSLCRVPVLATALQNNLESCPTHLTSGLPVRLYRTVILSIH